MYVLLIPNIAGQLVEKINKASYISYAKWSPDGSLLAISSGLGKESFLSIQN
jgi:hypothetical protein